MKLSTPLLLLTLSLGSHLPTLAAEPTNEWHIYVQTSLSGPRGYIGRAMMDGAGAYADEINRSGGWLGKPVRVIGQDDLQDVEEAVKIAKVALADPLHLATFGGSNSRISMPVARLYAKQSKLYFLTTATHTGIAKIGGSVFQVCINNLFQGTVLADAAINRIKAKRILVLTNRSDPYSDDLSTAFLAEVALKHAGASRFEYVSGQDFIPDLAKVIHTMQPEVVFIPAIREQAAEIARQLNHLKLRGFQILGSDGWGFQNETVKIYLSPESRALNRRYLIAFHWNKDVKTAKSREIARKISAYNSDREPPYAAGVFVFEGLEFLREASRATQSTSATVLAEYMRGRTFNGSTGKVTFLKDGSTERAMILVEESNHGQRVESVFPEKSKRVIR